jgi:hypothetical protein
MFQPTRWLSAAAVRSSKEGWAKTFRDKAMAKKSAAKKTPE